MNKILNIYKPSGLTPFEVIQKLRISHSDLNSIKIGYAGRLDPLAHGVMLLMIGDATKKRDDYLSLPKQYRFETVFGIQTDTYDVLGLLQTEKPKKNVKNVNLFVNSFVKKYRGKHLQVYPPYSSKAVNGKPLFWWARNNKLTEITIPAREIEIYDFTVVSTGEITAAKLKEKVFCAIDSVAGDFRQEKIKKHWEQYFSAEKTQTLATATFEITCSSGTYVRELVHQMGLEMGTGAIALNILRTSVGKHILQNAIKI